MVKAYLMLVRFGRILAPIVLLLIRLSWGWELAESGHGHLAHLDKTTDFFASLHIPAPCANAVVCGTTELVGGVLVMAGLGARLVALPLIFNFCVAFLTDAHDQVVHVLSNPDGVVDYAAFPFLMMALIMLAFGPGVISVDGILKHTAFGDKAPAAQA